VTAALAACAGLAQAAAPAFADAPAAPAPSASTSPAPAPKIAVTVNLPAGVPAGKVVYAMADGWVARGDSVYEWPQHTDEFALAQTTVNASHQAIFSLPAGNYVFGYDGDTAFRSAQVPFTVGTSAVTLPVTLVTPLTISGQVTRKDGKTAKGWVRLIPSDADVPDTSHSANNVKIVKIGHKGKYTFKGVDQGSEYAIAADVIGFKETWLSKKNTATSGTWVASVHRNADNSWLTSPEDSFQFKTGSSSLKKQNIKVSTKAAWVQGSVPSSMARVDAATVGASRRAPNDQLASTASSNGGVVVGAKFYIAGATTGTTYLQAENAQNTQVTGITRVTVAKSTDQKKAKLSGTYTRPVVAADAHLADPPTVLVQGTFQKGKKVSMKTVLPASGAKLKYAWVVNGKVVGTHKSLTIKSQWSGKKLFGTAVVTAAGIVPSLVQANEYGRSLSSRAATAKKSKQGTVVLSVDKYAEAGAALHVSFTGLAKSCDQWVSKSSGPTNATCYVTVYRNDTPLYHVSFADDQEMGDIAITPANTKYSWATSRYLFQASDTGQTFRATVKVSKPGYKPFTLKSGEMVYSGLTTPPTA
jgi:hypothetical protein